MVSSVVSGVLCMLAFMRGPPRGNGSHHSPVWFSLGGPILLSLERGTLHHVEITPVTKHEQGKDSGSFPVVGLSFPLHSLSLFPT